MGSHLKSPVEILQPRHWPSYKCVCVVCSSLCAFFFCTQRAVFSRAKIFGLRLCPLCVYSFAAILRFYIMIANDESRYMRDHVLEIKWPLPSPSSNIGSLQEQLNMHTRAFSLLFWNQSTRLGRRLDILFGSFFFHFSCVSLKCINVHVIGSLNVLVFELTTDIWLKVNLQQMMMMMVLSVIMERYVTESQLRLTIHNYLMDTVRSLLRYGDFCTIHIIYMQTMHLWTYTIIVWKCNYVTLIVV